MNNELKTGARAYYDAFCGLIPCTVLTVTDKRANVLAGQARFELTAGAGQASTRYVVTARLTANRGAYRKGEIIAGCSLHIVPRDCIKRRMYSSVIMPYAVVPD